MRVEIRIRIIVRPEDVIIEVQETKTLPDIFNLGTVIMQCLYVDFV